MICFFLTRLSFVITWRTSFEIWILIFHFKCIYKINVRETEGAIKDGQSRETGNIGHIRGRQTKQKKPTQYKLDPTVRRQIKITGRQKQITGGGRHGRGRMVVGFTTTYVISVYHH